MKLDKRAYLIVAGAAILIVVLFAAFAISRGLQANSAKVLETGTVHRGTLLATVSATGAISPLRQAELAFAATGSITKLDVKQGDPVKAGQVLASLDTRALEYQLAQAEASLAAAQAKFDQLKSPSAGDLAAAQAQVASAEAALAQLKSPNPNDLASARADLDKAQAALAQAQAAYDRAGGASNPLIGMLPQSLQLQQATDDYQKALALYNARTAPTDSQVKQAQATLEQARAQLAKLSQPSANDLKAAQASVDQATAARDLAKANIDNAVIRAPFDGIVTHVDYDLGSFATAARTVLGVADVSELRVKLNIDETDIAQVRVGQDVTIGLDAYPDLTLNAKVAEVAATATTVQGVTNYVVTIALKPDQAPMKIGMTADANIVVAKKDNVLLVPNQAVRAVASKRYVTIVKSGGQTEQIEVQLGLANDQETEVLSGLSEGQQVVTSAVQNLFAPPTGN